MKSHKKLVKEVCDLVNNRRLKLNDEVAYLEGWLQGFITIAYSALVAVLGQPILGSGDNKTDASWLIEFPDGIQAMIYNFKDGVAYNGKRGTPIEKITDWHVGSNNEKALANIRELFSTSTVTPQE
jgi:hypothetical protein